MNGQRKDAWSEKEDKVLLEIVISSIRKGKTQLNAFETAADKLNRTAAACGFRWNGKVRHQYKEEIELARKERKSSPPKEQKNAKKAQSYEILNESDVNKFKTKLDQTLIELEMTRSEKQKYKANYEELDQKYRELNNEHRKLVEMLNKVRESYTYLLD